MTLLIRDLTEIQEERWVHRNEDLTEIYRLTQTCDDIFEDDALMNEASDLLLHYIRLAKDCYSWGSKLLGMGIAFPELVLNAGLWGNQNKIGSEIKLSFKYGYSGGVILVQDQGDGFDYKDIIAKRQRGENYARRNGGGMKRLSTPGFFASYHGSGNIVSLATKICEPKW